MSKKWIVLAIVLFVLVVFWQIGGIDFILARTVFAPDYNPDLLEEENQSENNDGDTDELNSEEEPKDNSNSEEEKLFSTEDLDYEIEVIGEDLEIPWEIVPLPDGSFLVTERPGRVVMLD